MALTIAALQVKVGGDTSEAEGKLSSINSKVKESGGFFKSALANALGFAAGLGIFNVASQAVGFLKDQIVDVVKQGISQQQVMSETANTLAHMGKVSGQTADSIGNFADKMADLTGVQDDVIQHAENVMLTFGNIGPKAFQPATMAALNMSAMLHTNLQDSIIQVGKALNDPIKGLTALSRVGVSFTDQEKEQIKTMMAHHDVIGAQNIILGELQKQFGGAAVAAGKTFGGQLQILGVEFDQIKEKIGLAVLPLLTKLAGFVTSTVVPVVQNFAGWLINAGSAAGKNFGGMLKSLTPYLQTASVYVKGLSTALQFSLGPAFQAIGGLVKTIAGAFSGLSVTLSREDFAMILANISDDILGVADTVNSLAVPAIKGLSAIFSKDVVPAGRALANVVKTDIMPGLSLIAGTIMKDGVPAARLLITTISGDLVPILGHAGGIISGLGSIFKGLATIVATAVLPFVYTLYTWFATKILPILARIADVIASNLGPIFQSLGQQLSRAAPFFQSIFSAASKLLPVLTVLAQIVGGVLLLGLGIIIGVIRGVIGAFSGLIEIVSGVVNIISGAVSFVMDLFTGQWGKLPGDIGQIFGGIWSIIKGAFSIIIGAVSGFIGGVIDFFKSLAEKLVGHSIIPDMIASILSFFLQLPGKIPGIILGLISSVIGLLGSMATQAVAKGLAFVSGLAGAIANGVGSLVSAAGKLKDGVLGFFSGAASWLFNAGVQIISGIVNGIKSMAGNVGNAVKGVVNSIPGIGGIANWAGFATGTDYVPQSGVYKVGEKGEELVYLPRGAAVIPNNRINAPGLTASTAASAGRGNLTVIYQVDSKTVARQVLPHVDGLVRLHAGLRGA